MKIIRRALIVLLGVVVLYLIATAIDPHIIPQQSCARTCEVHE